MKEIKVTLTTLTPLWTGDAWGENTSIKPSSIMGSLRFWFEVFGYFSGITENNNYVSGKLKDNLNEEEFKKKILSNGNDFEGIDKTLTELGISLPSRFFGCTGWKGWVRIKEISNGTKYKEYNYPTGKIIFSELKYINKNGKKYKKEVAPAWYFPKGFYGEITIVFKIEKNIKDSVFYPLLTFVEKYGFLGGKWNIGYGRVKIENVEEKENGKWDNVEEWRKEVFKFNDKTINFRDFINEEALSYKEAQPFDFLKHFLGVHNFYCKNERDFKNKMSSIPRKFMIAKFDNLNGSYIDLIKELLKKKAEMRNCLRPVSLVNNKKLWNDFRHELLGTTSGGTEGTKIIPWIYEENGQIKGGFVSIAGIIKIGEKNGQR